MILSYKELSDKLGLSLSTIRTLCDRYELTKYNIIKDYPQRSRGLICNHESLLILSKFLKIRSYKNFSPSKWINLVREVQK